MSKMGWREIDGCKTYFRSVWEANYARYLQWLMDRGEIVEWLHEPSTFYFDGIRRGCVSYLPDFKIIKSDYSHYWVEVKGWMDKKSKTKIKRFRKYYPDEVLVVVDKTWFARNNAKMRILIKDWEQGHAFSQGQKQGSYLAEYRRDGKSGTSSASGCGCRVLASPKVGSEVKETNKESKMKSVHRTAQSLLRSKFFSVLNPLYIVVEFRFAPLK